MKKVFFSFLLLYSFLLSNAFDYKDWVDDGYREFKTGQEALYWGNTWTQGSLFSKEEQDIVYAYSTGSSIFNSKLRAGAKLESLPLDEQSKIKLLDQALNKFIIFEKIIVYRYANVSVLANLYDNKIFYGDIYSNTKFKDGAEKYLEDIKHRSYTDPGFMSTTLIRSSVFTYRPVELVIKIPKYSDGLFIARSGFSHFIQEYEILFPRNRTLYFEGFSISSDRKKITLYAKMQGPLWIVNHKKK